MRHTTSLAGAAEADDDPELLLLPQPAAAPASATAAQIAAADLVSFTARSPFRATLAQARLPAARPLRPKVGESAAKLTGNFPIR
jgi:hypothetical protein